MRDWLGRIFTRDNAALVLVIVCATIVLLLQVVFRADWNLDAWVVLFLDILAIGLLSQRVFFLDRIERSVATIRAGWPLSDIEAFHSSRESLPSIPERLRQATQEVFVVGMSLATLVTVNIGQLASKAEKGCQVRLLMMSPILEDGSPNPLVAALQDYHGLAGLDKTIRANIEQVIARQNALSGRVRENLQLRVYFALPNLSVFFVDAALARGRAVVELLPYHFDPSARPSFELSPSRSEKLFPRLYRTYQKMWDAGKTWPPTELELTFLGKRDDQVGPGPSQLGPDGQPDAVFLFKVGPWRHGRVIGQIDLFRIDEEGNRLGQHWTSSPHDRVWQMGTAPIRGGKREDVLSVPWQAGIRRQEELQFLLYASDMVPPIGWFAEGQWYEVQVHHNAGACTARACVQGS